MPSSKRSCATRPKPTLVTATARPGPARARRIASVLASGLSPNSARAKSWAAEQLVRPFCGRCQLPWSYGLSALQMVLHANIVAAQCVSLSRASGAEALLPEPDGASRFVHPSHPASVGLACRPVGAWRRQLVKQLDFTRGGSGHGHIFIGGGLAAV